MTTATVRRKSTADAALSVAAAFWLSIAFIGQWAFLYYIAAFYGVSTLSGDFEVWNRLVALGRTPFVAGDMPGNLTYAAHALAAGIIAFGGALQLLPVIRARWPVFHRWNGRLYLLVVTLLSLSGFYLVWIRRSSPDLTNAISTSFNGVLILVFATLALRSTLTRDFTNHRRWALRLYLVSNAQWFLRVGVFAYVMVNKMLGNKVHMSDPFLLFWVPGCYLVPLAMLEIYLRAKNNYQPLQKFAVAGSLVVLTLLMAVGIFGFGLFSQALVSGAPLTFQR